MRNVIKRNKKPVIIGDRVWIGNRVTIQCGSLPPDSVVGSGSLVNKDYSTGKNGLYAGIPAVFIKEGIRRIFDFQEEHKLDQFFLENRELNECHLN